MIRRFKVILRARNIYSIRVQRVYDKAIAISRATTIRESTRVLMYLDQTKLITK